MVNIVIGRCDFLCSSITRATWGFRKRTDRSIQVFKILKTNLKYFSKSIFKIDFPTFLI